MIQPKKRTRGGGGPKSQKFCERNKWMPPKETSDHAKRVWWWFELLVSIHKIIFPSNYFVTLTVFLRGPEIPEYVAKRVQDNERRYITNNKVNMNWPDTKISQNANLIFNTISAKIRSCVSRDRWHLWRIWKGYRHGLLLFQEEHHVSVQKVSHEHFSKAYFTSAILILGTFEWLLSDSSHRWY